MRVVFAFLTFAFLVVPQGALAQSPDPAEVNARRLYNAGEAAFEAERFDAALSYFEQSYELSHRPELLYNIGVSAERAGRTERAIEAFGRYIAERPDAPNRLEVEGRIEVLESERDAREAQATTPAPTTPEAASDEADEVAAPEPTAPRSSSGSRGLGFGVLGGSAALAAAGAVMLGLGAHDYATVEDAPDGTSWSAIDRAYDRAPRLSNAGLACGIAGLAGVAVGVVLVVGGGHEEPATEVAFTGTGLRVRRSF